MKTANFRADCIMALGILRFKFLRLEALAMLLQKEGFFIGSAGSAALLSLKRAVLPGIQGAARARRRARPAAEAGR